MPKIIRNTVVLCFCLIALVCVGSAYAQKLPSSQIEMKLSFAPLVKATSPSVVNIYTKRLVREQTRVNPFFGDPFFEQFFGRSFNGPVRERVTNALGSGVIIKSDGLVVTNAHVIKEAQEINVVLKDGKEFEAKQVFFDERIDLAVLKIDTKGAQLAAMPLGDNDDLEVGDLVLAIGNPFGVGQTVTSGIVSALARTAVGITDYSFFIQTDAAINPGNSGGALVSMDGKLVGINTAIFSRSGGSLGIGFAIPVDLLKTVIHSVELGRDKLVKPWIGATGQAVTSDIADNLGLPNTKGALTTYVHPQSPAAKAGLKVGDVVLSINGKEVQDPQSLKYFLAMVEIGKPIDFKIHNRKGQKSLSFKAILPPDVPAREQTDLQGHHPFNGATVANINPAVQDELSFYGTDEGVIIIKAPQRSRLGLQVGDVIENINGVKIESIKVLKDVLNSGTRTWRVKINRNGQAISLVITG